MLSDSEGMAAIESRRNKRNDKIGVINETINDYGNTLQRIE